MSNRVLNGLEIAVIGMAGQFPGAKNISEYWDNIYHARNCISRFTQEEMLADSADPALVQHPHYVNAGGVLEDIDKFDADFFQYSPNEAKILNPQHRLFLECAWHALEDAAYVASHYEGSIGVFAGSSSNFYLYEHLLTNKSILDDFGLFQLSIANSKDQLATRVSHALNLTGPSINVQTACSTSLVAIHLACQSLLNGECTMALAGAVSIQMKQKTGYLYREGMILSADGHCRAFDELASGTVGGNGVGIVVLKRYADALADGDRIDAIIKGSAINNDGNLKVGFTAPSIQRQSDVIAEAINMAEISAETIGYVETHGTGTRLGDPIEIAGLTQAFCQTTQKKRFCAIGSVKPNIGHLDAAAGIAGFIKTVLALKHNTIPKSLHFTSPNPDIPFTEGPFFVNQQNRAWDTHHGVRRAGVSAFGIGGTNAHLILEEGLTAHPAMDDMAKTDSLFCISAKSQHALAKKEQDLLEFLGKKTVNDYADIAYTLLIGRESFSYKKAFWMSDNDELKPCQNRVIKETKRNKRIAFMFPGQGTQYSNMAKDLYLENETFRYWIQHCAHIANQYLDKPILALLYPENEGVDNEIHDTRYAQPLLFIVEYALAQLWLSWGITPEIMIGHSLGEYVAATLAGVFAIEEALRVICVRATLMSRLPRGKMLAVFLPYTELKTMLHDDLSIAAVNANNICVVSGIAEAVDELQQSLLQKNIVSKMLTTSHAFHSNMMQPMLSDFQNLLETVKRNPPSIPYISNVTGLCITDSEAISPEYWALHLRQTVFFETGIQTISQYSDILLELGPGQTLCTLANNNLNHKDMLCIPSLPFIKHAVGQLWSNNIDLPLLDILVAKKNQPKRVSLPLYPFERVRHWVAPVCHTNQTNENSDQIESLPKQETDSPMQHELITIWASVLGVRHPDLNSTFSELGGHSLLAVQLVTKINRVFQRDFAIAWVIECNTIKKQIEFLDTNNVVKNDYQPIVLLSKNQSKIPLFFIHPGHAGAEAYTELAKLFTNKASLFALESYNLHSGQPFVKTIPDLAQTYLKTIQTMAPKGPYYLGGWSLGGTIAYEIAQILVQQGEEVSNIYMIDSYLFDDETQVYMERLDKMLFSLVDDPTFKALPSVYQNKILAIHPIELDMLRNYRAQPYTGECVLFNAKQPIRTKLQMNPEERYWLQMIKHKNGWENHALNMAEIIVDADHYSIMQTETLKKISKKITASLKPRSEICFG
jgi:phthiocerol/phenolphthiocerol synthesis type-I polyketide synthase E